MQLVKTLMLHKNISNETISYNMKQIVKFKELRHIIGIDIYIPYCRLQSLPKLVQRLTPIDCATYI